MTKSSRIGCGVAVAVPVVIICAFIYYVAFAPFGPGLDCMLKSNGRGIGVAIETANACRIKLLWPKEQGFNFTRSSTEYFRMLMSTEAGQIATNQSDQRVGDLNPRMLGGHGVLRAQNAASFPEPITLGS